MECGVLLVCPLFGGLSSLGVSFIGGFTVVKPLKAHLGPRYLSFV